MNKTMGRASKKEWGNCSVRGCRNSATMMLKLDLGQKVKVYKKVCQKCYNTILLNRYEKFTLK